MEIKSPEFKYGEPIPKSFTCLGPNISPPLYFQDIPEGTKSLVLIFEDVDATPKPWTHWMLFNIPPNTPQAEQGIIPEGAVEGLANNHSFGYEGPCPKYFKGTHQYWFRLYALSTVLDLPAATEREEIEEEMQVHIIEKAELLGLCIAPEEE
ncbi:MAG: YbhB YbcL family protein [Segetibacter sp.]|nr:YbhB YbcL family protein [Segetibacter sp.]